MGPMSEKAFSDVKRKQHRTTVVAAPRKFEMYGLRLQTKIKNRVLSFKSFEV